MALTDQQRRFAQGVASGKGPSEAYIAAGYKARGASAAAAASRLLTNVNLSAYLAELRSAVEAIVVEETGVDEAWITRKLKENVERAMQARAALDLEGNETGVYLYNGSVANRGLDILARIKGLYEPDADKDPVDAEQLAALLKEVVHSTRGSSKPPRTK